MSSDLHYLLPAVWAALSSVASSAATWTAIVAVLALLDCVVLLCFRVLRDGGEIEVDVSLRGVHVRAKGRE